jgi:17beta-estradiol 17-dehydrogenase / very-long-chain 3-oxoacyl-CoA reductase
MTCVFSELGYIVAGYVACRISLWVWRHFLRCEKDLRSFGDWAVITGCTDGIGRAVASEIAKQGVNLILVGRNPKKLAEVADEVAHSTVTKTVVVDFSGTDEERYKVVEEAMQGLDIGILIVRLLIVF